uniref:Uncharacterized protein n=1 Tax=Periophthalmus magnuspinnatus TaxID=409849 RepID=A0A3B4A430_9GOBI
MSGGNKALELQLQMRQNAEDLHSFMRELDTWEEDIKKKDEELRTGEVQGGEMREKKKKKPASAKRIKGYDYRSWDKFNVDKVLEEMDKEDSPVESNESDPEEITVSREKALAEKEKGNMFFKEAKYDDAIECYTRGMAADPYNPVLPTNRATAFFRLKKFKEAEEDCTKAISLDNTYSKAFARRATARVSLGKLEEAKKGNRPHLS